MNFDDTLPELQALLHPAQSFARPADVLHAAHLSRDEKRAILAAWASDACAVEAAPGLRRAPGGGAVAWDDIMDALQSLDRREAKIAGTAVARRTGSGTNGTAATL